MELVSQCSTAVKQAKTMHPQGNSASFSQQSHMTQSLSNIHTNPSPAHNYSSQHPFSLSVSSMNQNSDQPPASNHPTTSPSVGQSYNLQKSNNPTSVQNLQTVQPIASVAPQIADQALLEKSQANGTSEGESPQKSFVPSGFLLAKDKPSIQIITPAQVMEVDPLVVQEKTAGTSAFPIATKTDNAESLTPNSSPELPNAKLTKEVITPKEADSPSSSSATVELEIEKPIALLVADFQKEQDPLHIPEKSNKPEQKIEATKQELKLEKHDVHKNVGVLIKSTPADESLEERPIQKEVPGAKTVKTTPRKAKTTSSHEKNRMPAGSSTPIASSSIGKAKRQRIRTQHYQSPLPEVEFVSKISTTSLRNNDEKLIVFYKNEFLAVRNAEGGFYLCQAVQNIYKSSPKIKIRWLSQDKNIEKDEVYTPDFYDLIDFDCILTNLSLSKADKGKFILPPSEKARTESILHRSLAVEKGEEISSPSLTEEHPDGLDLSLYRDEDQLKKKRKGRKRSRKAAPSSAPKEIATRKSPKVSKVRKVAPAPVVKEVAPKKVVAKKPAKPVKKIVIPVEPKPVPSTSKISKVAVKINNKTTAKTSPVVDQKKAKVLARIGRKAAVVAAPPPPKPSKNNSKNGKAGNKAVGTLNKTTVQAKTSSNGSVKTTPRSVRKSTRK